MTPDQSEAETLDLAKLREIAEKALPGGAWVGEIVPQHYPESDDADLPYLVTDEQKRCVIYLPEAYGDRYRPYEADGEFIATFNPPTVLRLLALLSEQQVREPVAWRWRQKNADQRWRYGSKSEAHGWSHPDRWEIEPLYTAPPPPEQQVESGRLREALEKTSRALEVWREAFDTGRSEPLFIARDHADRVMADLILEASAPAPAEGRR